MLKNALTSLKEYQQVQGKEGGNNIVETRREKRVWKKPEEKFFKVNFDAATDEENKRVGLGIIVRNRKEEIMVSCCEQITQKLN